MVWNQVTSNHRTKIISLQGACTLLSLIGSNCENCPKTRQELKILLGDIEIVGALGDGLVAGIGALSSDIRDLSTQHRGVSFATGKNY